MSFRLIIIQLKNPILHAITRTHTKGRPTTLTALSQTLIRQWAVKGQLAKVKACKRGHGDERRGEQGRTSARRYFTGGLRERAAPLSFT